MLQQQIEQNIFFKYKKKYFHRFLTFLYAGEKMWEGGGVSLGDGCRHNLRWLITYLLILMRTHKQEFFSLLFTKRVLKILNYVLKGAKWGSRNFEGRDNLDDCLFICRYQREANRAKEN